MSHDLIIVGGGMAGLTCAWRLGAAGFRPLVLEAGDRPGGNVRSELAGGFLLERGPHTFLSSAHQIFRLAGTAGLDDRLVNSRPEAAARFIARGGRLHRAPDSPGRFLTTRLLSWRAKLRLAAEPLVTRRGRPGDTALAFFHRRFGAEAARVIAGAFISGVYAGDPAALSAPAAFPLFWGFEQQSGGMIRGALRHQRRGSAERRAPGHSAPLRRRGLWSFRGGLGQLSETLAAGLGSRYLGGRTVDGVSFDAGGFLVRSGGETRRAAGLVLAVPPHRASALLADAAPALSGLLAGIPMAPVAVVSLGFDCKLSEVPDGFGFLAPRDEGVRSLGILFPSRVFPGRAPDGGDLLTAYLGGMLDRRAVDLGDDELVGLVRGDLERLTGCRTVPALVRVARHPAAIPQLVVGHLERMAAVRQQLERVPGLHLAGNYLRGVGIKDAVASGESAAEAVIQLKRAKPAEAVA